LVTLHQSHYDNTNKESLLQNTILSATTAIAVPPCPAHHLPPWRPHKLHSTAPSTSTTNNNCSTSTPTDDLYIITTIASAANSNCKIDHCDDTQVFATLNTKNTKMNFHLSCDIILFHTISSRAQTYGMFWCSHSTLLMPASIWHHRTCQY